VDSIAGPKVCQGKFGIIIQTDKVWLLRLHGSELFLSFMQLLSEEVFDFSRGELTQLKIKELKNSLNR
jgi:hypothetical protein